MKQLLVISIISFLIVGCDSERYYAAITPKAPGVSAVHYPLDYPICRGIRGGVIAPLRFRLWGGSIADPVRLMTLRRQNPSANGCFSDSEANQQSCADIKNYDSFGNAGYYGGWTPLDETGDGNFAASAYRLQLLNAKDIEDEKRKKRLDDSTQLTTLAKLGFTFADVSLQDEYVTINGMLWTHHLTAVYQVTDPHDPTRGKLLQWRESYDHQLDGSHILRQQAHYNAVILNDPLWIAARRDLLLQLVKVIRIKPMTQDEVNSAIVEYCQQDQQNTLNWKHKRS